MDCEYFESFKIFDLLFSDRPNFLAGNVLLKSQLLSTILTLTLDSGR